MKQLVVISGLLLFIYSCQKSEYYPSEPHIDFKKYHVNADTVDALDNATKYVELTLRLTDGDGDIGFDSLVTSDTVYRSSIYTELYVKNKGVFEKISSETDLQNFKIPYIAEGTGQNKTMKADVKIKIEYAQEELPYDTVKYNIYLIDRALHKSNTITTPEIIFK